MNDLMKEGAESDTEEEQEAAPDYIFPIFFTTKTQELFNCKGDEDVTEENPNILIPKQKILEDFKERAAISDFHPAKSIVQNYPGDELLVVYDPGFKYGHNFFLVTTEEGKEAVLRPPEIPEEEDEQPGSEALSPEVLKSSFVLKPWESLGSEKEIEDENISETRQRVKFTISRLRKEFGTRAEFSDRDVSDVKDGLIECLSYEDEKFEISQKELDKGIQNVASTVHSGTQTNWPYPKNANVQCTPRVLEEEKREQIVKSADFQEFAEAVYSRFALALQHNETIDIFVDDYTDLGDEDSTFGSKSDNNLKEYQSFTDLQFSKNKIISAIQWHPTIRGLIAVSCAENLTFDERADLSSKLLITPSLILIWSFADPIHPLLLLEAPDDILCFQFNPSEPHIVAGGCINGQVVLWDINKYDEKLRNHRSQAQTGNSKNSMINTLPSFFYWDKEDRSPIVRYCAVSNIEHSHRMAITDIVWLPDHIEIARMGVVVENRMAQCYQLATCSSDGSVLFWDTRSTKSATPGIQQSARTPAGVASTFQHLDLTWKPMLKVTLSKLKGSGEMNPTKFTLYERQGDRRSVRSDGDKNSDLDSKQKAGGLDKRTSYSNMGRKKEESKALEHIKTKFYVATEDGDLVYTDWKLTKDMDSGKIVSPKPEAKIEAHDGPVWSLERSPFFKDVILSVGGWTFALWKEEVTAGPLLVSYSHTVKLTSARWSPTRPGVFFIGRQDGFVDVWDLLDKTHEPFLSQSVTPSSVLDVYPYQVSKKQQLLAVGDGVGTLHILEISWNLRQPSPNEVTVMENYFEREAKRLQYCEEQKVKRQREKKEKEDKDAAPTKEQKSKSDSVEHVSEDAMKQEYKDFLALERRILEDLGIRRHENGLE